jgi:hypothetical protein
MAGLKFILPYAYFAKNEGGDNSNGELSTIICQLIVEKLRKDLWNAAISFVFILPAFLLIKKE